MKSQFTVIVVICLSVFLLEGTNAKNFKRHMNKNQRNQTQQPNETEKTTQKQNHERHFENYQNKMMNETDTKINDNQTFINEENSRPTKMPKSRPTKMPYNHPEGNFTPTKMPNMTEGNFKQKKRPQEFMPYNHPEGNFTPTKMPQEYMTEGNFVHKKQKPVIINIIVSNETDHHIINGTGACLTDEQLHEIEGQYEESMNHMEEFKHHFDRKSEEMMEHMQEMMEASGIMNSTNFDEKRFDNGTNHLMKDMGDMMDEDELESSPMPMRINGTAKFEGKNKTKEMKDEDEDDKAMKGPMKGPMNKMTKMMRGVAHKMMKKINETNANEDKKEKEVENTSFLGGFF